MSQSNVGKVITCKSYDTSVSANRVVVLTAANQVDNFQTETQAIFGVALNDASATGDAVSVCLDGIVKIRAGGSISAGAVVTAQTDGGKIVHHSGHMVGAASTTTQIERVVGIAMEAGSTNSLVEVRLMFNPIMRYT